ncbi:MAG: WYL domain-containing protein [Anaerolineae bacterium]|jgi:CRISPR-associated endonuclease/helicase Cas3|nr:WYL domain-containing protein [Anaerolineae bacterium]
MTNKQKLLQKTISLLRQNRDGITTRELSEALDCNPSTAYRYLQELMDDGYIITEHEYERGRYRLEMTKSPYRLSFTPKEAVIIYLALRRYIRQTSHAPHFMISALNQVADALQRPDLVSLLHESVQYLEKERPMPEGHNRVWELLIQAWLNDSVAQIAYQKARQNELEYYKIAIFWVEPAVLSDGTYIIAWAFDRDDLRTFKTDRIHAVEILGKDERIAIERQKFSLIDLLKHSWGIWYGQQTTHFELRFLPHVANRVMEQVFHPTEQKQVLSDGSVLWTADLAGDLEILSWVRSWGPDVQVLAPASFRERITDDLRRAMNLYLHDE